MAQAPRQPTLARGELRAALVDLCRIAAAWETTAPRRGAAETRAADQQLLRAVVDLVTRHQTGEQGVPIARSGRHVVRRIDLRLARVHAELAEMLREAQAGLAADEVLDRLHQAFASGRVKSVTRERLLAALQRFMAQSHPDDWITVHRGPEQAAADLMSAVGPRSGRYPFLVKQLLAAHDASSPADLELLARGKLVPRRELLAYLLALGGLSQRQISRVMDLLYRPRAPIGSQAKR